MKIPQETRLEDIAKLIDAEIIGHTEAWVTGLNEIHKVEEGDITFVDVEKYFKKALNSAASYIILNKKIEAPTGKSLLLHPKPFEAYNTLVAHFYPVNQAFDLENDKAISCQIDPSAQIHRGVVLGNNVSIGANSIIFPNVVIYDNVHIGKNVIIHSGSILGIHAFYYGKQNGQYVKWHSCGSVHIHDYVEIGACCTIDKGVSGKTIIGEGTKLDNQVHVGHGVEIGKNCLFAAQCGIGGKTIIEDDVMCWGQVGITKDVRIGKGSIFSAKCGISKSLSGGKVYFGSPARELRVAQKELAALRSLPEFMSKSPL